MQANRRHVTSPNIAMDAGDSFARHGDMGMGQLLRRQAFFVLGVLIWAFVVFLVLALASWNVADPSFSHATENPVTNWMGFAGSATADLLMQFFGVAASTVILPLAFVGMAMIFDRSYAPVGKRVAAWIFGSLFAAGFFSALPMAQSWPLPSGLGGVFGDIVVKLPGMLSGGYPTGLVAFVTGLVLLPAASLLIAVACGLLLRERTHSGADDIQPNLNQGEDSDDGFARFVSIGAVLHGFYSIKSFFRRLISVRRPEKLNPELAIRPQIRVEPAMETAAPTAEPFFEVDRSYSREMPPSAEQNSDDSEPWEDTDGWVPVPAPNSAPPSVAPSTMKRVVDAPSKPKPGVRVQREAQKSLIDDGGFELPSLHVLSEPKNVTKDASLSPEALEQNARLLEGVLEDFGVKGEIIQVRPGPVVTMYELEPAPGIKSSRVIGLAEDIARSMSAIAARVAVVPGRNAIGIELPNSHRETVYLRELLSAHAYESSKAKLALTLGKTINGDAVIADLAKMPHLLVAGTTGSGKSVAINTMILSLLYKLSPDQCRLIMIDPKMLELSVYDGIPHLLTPVVTDPKKAVVALKWTVREMEQRYKNMSKLGVRNIDGFNARVKEALTKGEELTRTVQTGFDRDTGEAIYETEALDLEPMPYIVVIIDEMADLMMVAGKDIEGTVQRLAQMARAAGIHVIMATQRPSVDVITGTIKANFPTRISFQVTSKIDSRTILGEQGAEQLLGMGDMLYMAGGGRIQRVHGPFVDDSEVEDVVSHLKMQGVPQYLEAVTEDDEDDVTGGDSGSTGSDGAGSFEDSDDPYDQAVSVVLRDRKASTSYIQRRLGIGYNRAASLIERMEEEGLIGPANHAGKREILVPSEEEQQMGGMN